MAVDAGSEADRRAARLTEQRRAPARPAGRLPVPRRSVAASSTSARPSRSASASRATSPTPSQYGTTGADRRDRPHRVARRRTPRRRRCSPSRTSSSSTSRASTSGCATTSPIRSSRSASTRTSRASTSRASATAATAPTSAPTRRAKRVRGTLDLLGKIFLFRSCEGTEPGRHSGSPCLDYYIKRCGAPCVGYVSREEYREGIDGVVRLPVRALQRDRARPRAPHVLRRRRAGLRAGRRSSATGCSAVRALLERQRVANEGAGTFDAVAVAVDGTEANAQVFQVRDGVLSRPPVLLPRQPGRAGRRRSSPRSSSCSTTRARSRSRR